MRLDALHEAAINGVQLTDAHNQIIGLIGRGARPYGPRPCLAIAAILRSSRLTRSDESVRGPFLTRPRARITG